MFDSHVDWSDVRAPQSASAAPIRKPENPESTGFWVSFFAFLSGTTIINNNNNNRPSMLSFKI